MNQYNPSSSSESGPDNKVQLRQLKPSFSSRFKEFFLKSTSNSVLFEKKFKNCGKIPNTDVNRVLGAFLETLASRAFKLLFLGRVLGIITQSFDRIIFPSFSSCFNASL